MPPPIASREAWLDARRDLLAKEIELTRARDRLNEERRRLPMVEVDKSFIFDGPSGPARARTAFPITIGIPRPPRERGGSATFKALWESLRRWWRATVMP